MSNYYINNGRLVSEDELYHYGVKGMKWGVRRDVRLLANSRRNDRVRSAKRAYKEGKITKADRKKAIKAANLEKKEYIKQTKERFANAGTKAERKELKRDIANKTVNSVHHATIKRGAATVNALIGVASVGTMGVSAAIGAAAAPALAGVVIGSNAVGIAAEIGRYRLVRMGLDKLS